MYTYVVAVKDYKYEEDIFMEITEFLTHPSWKEVYLAVVGDYYFDEDEFHKEMIHDMPEHFADAKIKLRDLGIYVEILPLVGY